MEREKTNKNLWHLLPYPSIRALASGVPNAKFLAFGTPNTKKSHTSNVLNDKNFNMDK